MNRYLQTDLTAIPRVKHAKWAMNCIGSAIDIGARKAHMFTHSPGKQAS
jgi:hypothetical protein